MLKSTDFARKATALLLPVTAVIVAALMVTGLQNCSPPGDDEQEEVVPVETVQVVR